MAKKPKPKGAKPGQAGSGGSGNSSAKAAGTKNPAKAESKPVSSSTTAASAGAKQSDKTKAAADAKQVTPKAAADAKPAPSQAPAESKPAAIKASADNKAAAAKAPVQAKAAAGPAAGKDPGQAKATPEAKSAVKSTASKAEGAPKGAPAAKSAGSGKAGETSKAKTDKKDEAAQSQAEPASAAAEPVTGQAAAASSSAPGGAPGEAPAGRPSNIVVGLALAVFGVGLVGVITLFTPAPHQEDLPYLLAPIEKTLDSSVRYHLPRGDENKDWHTELTTEQLIWRTELSKIQQGSSEAKPIERKRDFLLYLGDSFYRDEPKFEEAKAAYLNATAIKPIPHAGSYELPEDELWRRIAYCDMRLGHYDEAEIWLKKAVSINDEALKAAEKKGQKDIPAINSHNAIYGDLAQLYARKGDSKKAIEIVDQRMKEMGQTKVQFCVEINLLYAMALAKQADGDLKTAEEFYKKAIEACNREDLKRAVVPEGPNDSNRELAHILKDYAHLLRIEHHNDEAFAMLRRAIKIYDNPPP